MVGRRRAGLAVLAAGSAVVLVGTFLPWLRSGARDRSSYQVFELVDRLGFAPDGPVGWSLRAWPLVPLLVVACVLAAMVAGPGRHAPTVLAWGVATWIGGTSVAVLAAPDAGLLRIGVGPWVTLVGSAVIATGAWLVTPPRSGSSAAA